MILSGVTVEDFIQICNMIKRKKNETLEEQYKLQGSQCFYCKDNTPYELITRDHFEPLSKGNTLINNKVFACRPCNNMKGNRTLEQFKSLMIKRCCDVLRKVIEQDWKISQEQLDMFRHHVRVINNLEDLISKGSKPENLFT